MNHARPKGHPGKRPYRQAARSALSVLLSLSMVWSTIPTQALAEAAAEAQEAVAAQQVVQEAAPQEGATSETIAATTETPATESAPEPSETTATPEATSTTADPVTVTTVPDTEAATTDLGATEADPAAPETAFVPPASDPGADARTGTDVDGTQISATVGEPAQVAPRLLAAPRKAPAATPGAQTLDGTTLSDLKLGWITADSETEHPEDPADDSLLSLQPTGNNPISAVMQLSFNLSGEKNYNPGDIRITVPGHIFRTREQENAGEAASYGNLVIPFEESPSTKNEFAWSYDAQSDTYTFHNTHEMRSASAAAIQLGIEGLTPSEIKDGSTTDSMQATITVTTHQGNELTAISPAIAAHVNTSETIHGATKQDNGYQIVDRDQIPQEVLDRFAAMTKEDGTPKYPDERYFVLVEWRTYATHSGNTTFSTDWRDTPLDHDGQVVYNDGASIETVTASSVEGTTNQANTVSGTENADTWWGDGTTNVRTVRVAYPLSQFDPDTHYEITNRVDWVLTPTDGDPASVATADSTVNFYYEGGDNVQPYGDFDSDKFSNGKDDDLYFSGDAKEGRGTYEAALDKLAAGTATQISYRTPFVGWGLAYTLNGSSSTPSGTRTAADYGKSPYTMTMTDDPGSLVLSGLANADMPHDLVAGEDYTIAKVRFTRPTIYKAVDYDGRDQTPGSTLADESGNTIYAGRSRGQNVPAKGGTRGVGFVEDSDYSHAPDYQLEAEVDGQWVSAGTVSWKEGEAEQTVDLPKGATRYRLTVTTAIAAIEASGVYPVVELRPSGYLKGIAQRALDEQTKPSLNVRNTEHFEVTLGDGSLFFSEDEDRTDTIQGFSNKVSASLTKRSTLLTPGIQAEGKVAKVRYNATLDLLSNIDDKEAYEQALATGAIAAETAGTWYDLLPQGFVPDLATVTTPRQGDSVEDVQAIQNYKGTGRTLLVVQVRLTPSPTTQTSWDGKTSPWRDQPQIQFDGTYPYQAYVDYGANLHNVIAYESANESLGNVENYSGEPDAPKGNNASTTSASTFADDAERQAMTDLDPTTDKPAFAYAGDSTSVDYIHYTLFGLNKQVDVNGEENWGTGVSASTDPAHRNDDGKYAWTGGTYQYRVTVSPSQLGQAQKGIVIYDEIEQYQPTSDKADAGDAQWHGRLRGLDLSALRELGVDPKVYYTTTPRDQLDIANDGDGTQESVELNQGWDLTTGQGSWQPLPDDPSTELLDSITAIAVDARTATDGSDFLLDDQHELSFRLTMLAPTAQEAAAGNWLDDAAHAYNNAYLTATTVQATSGQVLYSGTIRKDYTKVGLKPYQVTATKLWADKDNQDGVRPGQVTFYLVRDGQRVEGSERVLAVNADGTTTPERAAWDNLDRMDPETGSSHTYTVGEEPVDGYTLTRKLTAEGTYELTNAHTPETVRVRATKTWKYDDPKNRPTAIGVRVYADGKERLVSSIRPDAQGNWVYESSDLPRYRDGGQEIVYTVQEAGVDSGYVQSQTATTTPDGTINVSLVNTWHPYGDLVISKKVQDATTKVTSDNRDFLFRLDLKTADGSTYLDGLAYQVYNVADDGSTTPAGQPRTTTTGGVIALKANQQARVEELPDGISYTVTEQAAAGFAADASERSGTVTPNTQARADFTNTYATQGRVSLGATKTMEGQDLKSNAFRFEVRDATEGSPTQGSLVKWANNGKDGTVNFGSIAYGNADDGKTYTYEVSEYVPASATNAEGVTWEAATADQRRAGGFTYKGYTYDGTLYRVVASPHDQGDGTMKVDMAYYDADGNALEPGALPSFKNSYQATGQVDLVAQKTIQGGSLEDGAFTFDLHASKGAPLPNPAQVTNQADGTVAWKGITFTQAHAGRTYLYWASEDPGETPGPAVNYDQSVKAWTAQVTDQGDGTLAVSTRNVTVDGLEADSIVVPGTKDGTFALEGSSTDLTLKETTEAQAFNNSYKPGQLDITKALTDDADTQAHKDQDFTFKVVLDGAGRSAIRSYQVRDDATGEVAGIANSVFGKATTTAAAPAKASLLEALASGVADAWDGLASGVSSAWTALTSGVAGLLAPTQALAEDYLASGTWGTSPWHLDREGNLYVGAGTAGTDVPWASYMDQIKKVLPPTDGTVVMAPTSLSDVFSGATALESVEGLASWDVSAGTTMKSAFAGTRSLGSLEPLRSWKTSSVTNMNYTFLGSGVVGLDLSPISGWDVRNVLTMYQMFLGTGATTMALRWSTDSLGARWDTLDASNPIAVLMAFAGPSSNDNLETVDISTWNTRLNFSAGGIDRNDAFGASTLRQITLGKDTPLTEAALPRANDRYLDAWGLAGTDVVLTAAQLAERSQSAEGAAGTWVRQQNTRAITYDANGGAGTMAAQAVWPGQTSNLSANSFSRFGYDFTGWNTKADGTGTSYDDHATVYPSGTASAPGSLAPTDDMTLYAQWKPRAILPNLDGDGYLITIKGGQTALIDDLPAGAGYKVYEQTPQGWVLVKSANTSGTIDPLGEDVASFTNQYASAKTTAKLEATKLLDGKPAQAGLFSFTLTGQDGAPMPAGATGDSLVVPNGDNGGVDFGPITYDQPGTYTYTITEVAGTNAAIDYDTSTWTATVTVTKDDGTGALSASVAYAKQGSDAADQSATFNNYDRTPKTGSLTIRKATAGSYPAGKDTPTFTFDVTYVAAGVPTTQTVKITGSGTATVRGIPVGATYTVTERDLPAGWTLTGSSGTTGTIGLDASNPRLVVTPPAAAFTNTYQPTGQVQLEASKRLFLPGLEGSIRMTLKGGEYSFQLVEVDADGYELPGAQKIVAANGATATSGQGTSYDPGLVRFPPIDYTKPGTYHYAITEIPGVDPTIGYASIMHFATVEVTDDGQGNLTSAVTYDYNSTSIDFVNSVRTGHLSIQKRVQDSPAVNADRDYAFRLRLSSPYLTSESVFKGTVTGGNQDRAVYVWPTGAPSDDGTYTYAPFTLKAGETVTFDGIPAGASYSWEEVDVPQGYASTLAYPKAQDGTELPRRVVADAADGTATTQAVVATNAYQAAGTAQIEATKTMDGLLPAEGAFTFQLFDSYGSLVATATNDGTGKVTFPQLTFDQTQAGTQASPKTYTYTIREQAGDDASVDYDSRTHRATVRVWDEDGTGTLKTSVTYDGLTSTTPPTFRNTTKKGSVTLEKVVEDGTAAVANADQTYTFDVTLSATGTFVVYDGVGMKVGQVTGGKGTVTLKAGQKLTIRGLPVGTTYSFKERDVDGMTVAYAYSDGQSTVTGGTSDKVTVTNTYVAKGSAQLEATKTLKGRDLKEGEFTFLVVETDADGTPLAGATPITASNDAQGKVTFPQIAYTNKDVKDAARVTRYYAITEAAGADPKVAYDDTTVMATVTLVDDGAGTIKTTVTYGDGPVAAFTNWVLSQLPQTGAEGLAGLATLGLVAVGASGAGFLRRSRRREE